MLVTIKNGLKKYPGWLTPFHDQRRVGSWRVVVWPIYSWVIMKQWRVKLRRIAWVGEGCKRVFSASSSSSSYSFISNGAFQRDFPFLLSQYIFWQHPPSQILPTWTHCKKFPLLVLFRLLFRKSTRHWQLTTDHTNMLCHIGNVFTFALCNFSSKQQKWRKECSCCIIGSRVS